MHLLVKVLSGYYLILNLVAFFIMVWDKYAAGKDMDRIPEKRFALLALLGGALGLYIAGYLVRHKTKKTKFIIGLPVGILAHIVIYVYLISIIR